MSLPWVYDAQAVETVPNGDSRQTDIEPIVHGPHPNPAENSLAMSVVNAMGSSDKDQLVIKRECEDEKTTDSVAASARTHSRSGSPIDMKPHIPSLKRQREGPTPKLVVHNLPNNVQKDLLSALFSYQGTMPTDIRMVQREENGVLRTMAFVDFPGIESSSKWMDNCEGKLVLPDGYACAVEYGKVTNDTKDWVCAKCSSVNFCRREACFQCNTFREESEEMEAKGTSMVGQNPCDTLILRDLPKGVNGPKIAAVLSRMAELLPIVHIHMAKSRKYAFVQMQNPEDAGLLLNCFNRAPLHIEGNIVLIDFAKSSFKQWEAAQSRPLPAVPTASPAPGSSATQSPAPSMISDYTSNSAANVAQQALERAAQFQRTVTEAAQQQQMVAFQHLLPQFSMPPPGMVMQGPPLNMGMQGPPPNMGMQGPPPNMGMQGPSPNMGMPPPNMQFRPPNMPPMNRPPPSVGPPFGGNMNVPPPGVSILGLTSTNPFGPGPATQKPPFGLLRPSQQPQPGPGMPWSAPPLSQSGPMGGPGVMPSQQLQQLIRPTFSAPPPNMIQPNMTMPPPNVQIPPPMGQQTQPLMGLQPPMGQQAPPLIGLQPQALMGQQPPLIQQQPPPQAVQPQPVVTQPSTPDPMSAPPGGVIGTIETPYGTYPKYVSPNPAVFTVEPVSGYHLDTVTMFYYDTKTTYYYNNANKKWCMWDSLYSTYIPVEEKTKAAKAAQEAASVQPSTQTTATNSASSDSGDFVEDPSKKSNLDVAREMMKWAKKQEKQEKSKIALSLKPLSKPLEKSALVSPSAGNELSGEVGLKMVEVMHNPLRHIEMLSDDDDDFGLGPAPKRHRDSELPSQQPVSEDSSVPSAALQREQMEESLIDRQNKTCLLCRRAFPSVDVLEKHVGKSELHATNLEAKRVEWGKAYVASLMAKVGKGMGTQIG